MVLAVDLDILRPRSINMEIVLGTVAFKICDCIRIIVVLLLLSSYITETVN